MSVFGSLRPVGYQKDQHWEPYCMLYTFNNLNANAGVSKFADDRKISKDFYNERMVIQYTIILINC